MVDITHCGNKKSRRYIRYTDVTTATSSNGGSLVSFVAWQADGTPKSGVTNHVIVTLRAEEVLTMAREIERGMVEAKKALEIPFDVAKAAEEATRANYAAAFAEPSQQALVNRIIATQFDEEERADMEHTARLGA